MSTKLYEHLFIENANDPYDIVALMTFYRDLCDVDQLWLYSPIMSERQMKAYTRVNGGVRNKTVFCVDGHLGIKVVGNFFKNLAHKIGLRSAELCTNHFLRGLMMTELRKFKILLIVLHAIVKY